VILELARILKLHMKDVQGQASVSGVEKEKTKWNYLS